MPLQLWLNAWRRLWRQLPVKDIFHITVIVVFISNTALLLSLAQLPYWIDEVASMVFAQRPFFDVLRYAAADIHPPLYFILLHGWTILFGATPAVTAGLSIILFCVAAVLVYRLSAAIFDPATARISVPLFTSSFFFLYYATETRMYMLTLVAFLSSNLFLYRWLQQPSRSHYGWYWLWCVVGVYTHYFFWLYIAVQNIVVLVLRSLKMTPISLRRWAIVQGCIVAAYLPWLPVTIDRVTEKIGARAWMQGLTVGQRLFTHAVNGFVTNNPLINILFVSTWWSWAGLIIISAFFCTGFIRRRRGKLSPRERDTSAPVIFLALLTILPPLIGSLSGVWFPRYVIGTGALLFIALARWLVVVPPLRLRYLLVTGALVTMSVVNWRYYLGDFRHLVHFYWEDVASRMERVDPSPSDAIFLVAPEEWMIFRYYYQGQLPLLSFLPQGSGRGASEEDIVSMIGLPVITPDNIGAALETVRPYKNIWLVSGPSVPLLDRQRAVPQWLGRFCLAGAPTQFVGVPSWVKIEVVRYDACQWPPIGRTSMEW
ncbi:MAG: glycosyltransferase family 39 protein [Patescibacteria group bacterium]|nr:glycosyltransferase family 39 protein [Patescibacteria group bacterium]